MGCCLSSDNSIAGIEEVCVEEAFIAAYNAEILGVSKTNGPNKASEAIGAPGAPQPQR
jgi:hypothetical protein